MSTFTANGTGHAALTALAEQPGTLTDLRHLLRRRLRALGLSRPEAKKKAFKVIEALLRDGLVSCDRHNHLELTARGRLALDQLNHGADYVASAPPALAAE